MDKTTISGHDILTKSGTIESVGNANVTSHYSDFAAVNFTDGEAIRHRVLAEGAISGLVSPDTSGRFFFAPWGNKRVLLAVDLDGRGRRTADPRYFSRARNVGICLFVACLPFLGLFALSLAFGAIGVVITGVALLIAIQPLRQAVVFGRMAKMIEALDKDRQVQVVPEAVGPVVV